MQGILKKSVKRLTILVYVRMYICDTHSLARCQVSKQEHGICQEESNGEVEVDHVVHMSEQNMAVDHIKQGGKLGCCCTIITHP